MNTFLTVVYIFVCLFLILVVLLQSGKGGGLGGLAGGSSQQVFGGAGAGNLLTRATAVAAALFMGLSVALSYMSSPGEQALSRAVEAQQEAAATVGAQDEAATSETAATEADAGGEAESGQEAAASGDAALEIGDVPDLQLDLETQGAPNDGTDDKSAADAPAP